LINPTRPLKNPPPNADIKIVNIILKFLIPELLQAEAKGKKRHPSSPYNF